MCSFTHLKITPMLLALALLILVAPYSLATMVLIPAGTFQMGDTLDGMSDAPVHEVYLDTFYIDAYEVTNAQYKEFVDATGHPAPRNWSDGTYPIGKADHPVTFVSWFDVNDYSQWAGKRLPTEAEWEKAARGGVVSKRYPWGNEITASDANYDKNIGDTTPVSSYPPNGYGLYDVAGNVWEWCSDWYDPNYYKNSPSDNPLGSDSGTSRVLRGGSWRYSSYHLHVAFRLGYYPTYADDDVGFRCVSDTPEAPIPEPSTILLLTTGLAGFAGLSFRRKRRKKV